MKRTTFGWRLIGLVVVSLLALAAATPVAQASIAQFTGNWRNVDSNTGGITRLEIKASGTNLTIHAWGKCSPTDCDWGETSAWAYGPNVSADLAGTAQVVTAVFKPGHADEMLVIHRLSGDRLQAELLTHFTDGSGRTDYSATYTFQRDQGLIAPKHVSPANGSVFSNFPRTTKLVWKPVAGAANYTVEVDCFHCCENNKWCADVGKTWKNVPGVNATSYIFDFVGAQPGRWRVWAVDGGGQAGPKSGWWEFKYTK